MIVELLTERRGTHSNQLSTVADNDGQPHGSHRRTEDITMDQFPAIVFLDIFLDFDGIVAADIFV
jgi:hypothetical protein